VVNWFRMSIFLNHGEIAVINSEEISIPGERTISLPFCYRLAGPGENKRPVIPGIGILVNFAVNFYNNKYSAMYPEQIVIPMKEELTENGFSEMLTPSDVNEQLEQKGTTLVMINSVCGCSAGSARPGLLMALANSPKKPDHLTTSFAGFDIDAVGKLRERLLPYPPSSPSIALFKDGQLVHMVERHQIEGRPPQMIAHHLIATFNQHC
jgi:putative YphP/YqiW family bacilliredoxin